MIENTIIVNILQDKDFAFKVLPYMKSEYFDQYPEVAEELLNYFNVYGTIPSKDELGVEISQRHGLSDKRLKELTDYIHNLDTDEKVDSIWLLSKTDNFFRNKAVRNAIYKSVKILEKDETEGIENLIQKALAVSLDNCIGLDYHNDTLRRYEMYHKQEEKISWGIKALDDITDGGMSKKTLNCVVAPTGVGKSLFLCSIASNVIKTGKNVLYISMEMSEERVAERIDANLFHTSIQSLHSMSKEEYYRKAKTIKEKVQGSLVIREYPTSGANINHFKNLLHELSSKKNFIPELIVVDYLNICASSRVRQKDASSSYGYIKAISEELRQLAVENNCAVITATQTNRGGFNNSDIEITDTSESMGTTHVLDLFLALIRTDALDEQGQIMIKQLKNRYADLGMKPQIILGLDKSQMRVYDLDSSDNYLNTNNYTPTKIIEPKFNGSKPKTDFSNFDYGDN